MRAMPEYKSQVPMPMIVKAIKYEPPVIEKIDQSSKEIENYFDESFKDENSNKIINIAGLSAVALYFFANIVTVDINQWDHMTL